MNSNNYCCEKNNTRNDKSETRKLTEKNFHCSNACVDANLTHCSHKISEGKEKIRVEEKFLNPMFEQNEVNAEFVDEFAVLKEDIPGNIDAEHIFKNCSNSCPEKQPLKSLILDKNQILDTQRKKSIGALCMMNLNSTRKRKRSLPNKLESPKISTSYMNSDDIDAVSKNINKDKMQTNKNNFYNDTLEYEYFRKSINKTNQHIQHKHQTDSIVKPFLSSEMKNLFSFSCHSLNDFSNDDNLDKNLRKNMTPLYERCQYPVGIASPSIISPCKDTDLNNQIQLNNNKISNEKMLNFKNQNNIRLSSMKNHNQINREQVNPGIKYSNNSNKSDIHQAFNSLSLKNPQYQIRSNIDNNFPYQESEKEFFMNQVYRKSDYSNNNNFINKTNLNNPDLNYLTHKNNLAYQYSIRPLINNNNNMNFQNNFNTTSISQPQVYPFYSNSYNDFNRYRFNSMNTINHFNTHNFSTGSLSTLPQSWQSNTNFNQSYNINNCSSQQFMNFHQHPNSNNNIVPNYDSLIPYDLNIVNIPHNSRSLTDHIPNKDNFMNYKNINNIVNMTDNRNAVVTSNSSNYGFPNNVLKGVSIEQNNTVKDSSISSLIVSKTEDLHYKEKKNKTKHKSKEKSKKKIKNDHNSSNEKTQKSKFNLFIFLKRTLIVMIL